jgi:putative chitinase
MTTRPLSGVIVAIAPHLSASLADAWGSALADPMKSSGITTPRRVAAFLGQIAVESFGFTELEENLNYSAGRLEVVWPKRFPAGSPNIDRCARNPEALANAVYCDRMGNGDEASGDGWTYRGRGLIQITGRANYEALAKADARAADPDWLTTPAGAAVSACWFWTTRKPSLNLLADNWELTAITRAINGGTEGLEERISLSATASRWLS